MDGRIVRFSLRFLAKSGVPRIATQKYAIDQARLVGISLAITTLLASAVPTNARADDPIFQLVGKKKSSKTTKVGERRRNEAMGIDEPSDSTPLRLTDYHKGGVFQVVSNGHETTRNRRSNRPVASVEPSAVRTEEQDDLQAVQFRLESALSVDREDPEILKALGEVLLDRCLAQSSRICYERAYKIDPTDPDTQKGLARAHLKSRDFRRAEKIIDRALRSRPDDGELLALKAKLLTHGRHYRDALEVLQDAKKNSPEQPLIYSTLATIHFRLRDMDLSRNELFETIRVDPNNTFAHHRLGTGSGIRDDGYGKLDQTVIRRLVESACEHLRARRWEEARDILMASANGRYRRKSKLHHLLALALTEIEFERHAATDLTEFRTLFRLLPEPPIPGIEAVVDNFELLTPDERKVVRIAIAPFAHLLPKLAQARASHHILALMDEITDLDNFQHLKSRATFDQRHYAHVRGLGGLHAATGREYLWEAQDFRYNTLAHEFAHQIHLHAFSKKERDKLELLYKKALRDDRAMDYYARSDVAEYFAQGYEAYVSFFKRPCLSSTAGHTRSELEDRDPELFAFLRRLTSARWEAGGWMPLIYEKVAKIHYELGADDSAQVAIQEAVRHGLPIAEAKKTRNSNRRRLLSLTASSRAAH